MDLFKEFVIYNNIDEMYIAVLPNGLNDKEIKFFKKWYKKFGYNTEYNTKEFIKYVKKNNELRFRDNLYQFNNYLKSINLTKNKQYVSDINEINQQNCFDLVRYAEFCFDELKLLGDKTKNGEQRSQIKTSISYLKKAIDEYNCDLPLAYKLSIQWNEKYNNSNAKEILSLINKCLKNCKHLSKTNIDWFNKKQRNYSSK